MLNALIGKISQAFIDEAVASPNLLSDMAKMEKYMAESYSGRVFIVFAAWWWAVNPLMRPRGSKLFVFWGRARCIANEILMIVMCIAFMIGNNANIGIEQITSILVVAGGSLVVGFAATVANGG